MNRRTPLLLASLSLVACSRGVIGFGGGGSGPSDAAPDDSGPTPPALVDGAVPPDASVRPPDLGVGPQSGGPMQHSIPPECLAAADKGVMWLVGRQQPNGMWSSGGNGMHPIADTGMAIVKLETHAIENGLSPFDPNYAYYSQVQKGLTWLFGQAHLVGIHAQLHGDPDVVGDGKAVQWSSLMYEQAIATMAIAAGSDPTQVVHAPGSDVDGKTFAEVEQRAVDFDSFAQSDCMMGCPRGGWRYNPMDGTCDGDNSVSQWVALAMEYAEHPSFKYKSKIPDWVKMEIEDWIACVQDMSGGPMNGASGYDKIGYIPNAYKTGAILQQLAFLGSDKTAPRAQAALGFIAWNWDDKSGLGWRTSGTANYLAMYAIMKGMESMGLDDLQGIPWYDDFCKVLIHDQNPDGSWPKTSYADTVEPNSNGVLTATEWALLILERAAPPPPAGIQ